jgi:hypothetical protein
VGLAECEGLLERRTQALRVDGLRRREEREIRAKSTPLLDDDLSRCSSACLNGSGAT